MLQDLTLKSFTKVLLKSFEFKSGSVLLISSPGSESQIVVRHAHHPEANRRANFRLQINPRNGSGDPTVPSALEGLTSIYEFLNQVNDLTILFFLHPADFLKNDLLLYRSDRIRSSFALYLQYTLLQILCPKVSSVFMWSRVLVIAHMRTSENRRL